MKGFLIESLNKLFFSIKTNFNLYKNTQSEISPKIKNKLRTITRRKFSSEKFKNFINSCSQIEMYM